MPSLREFTTLITLTLILTGLSLGTWRTPLLAAGDPNLISGNAANLTNRLDRITNPNNPLFNVGQPDGFYAIRFDAPYSARNQPFDPDTEFGSPNVFRGDKIDGEDEPSRQDYGLDREDLVVNEVTVNVDVDALVFNALIMEIAFLIEQEHDPLADDDFPSSGETRYSMALRMPFTAERTDGGTGIEIQVKNTTSAEGGFDDFLQFTNQINILSVSNGQVGLSDEPIVPREESIFVADGSIPFAIYSQSSRQAEKFLDQIIKGSGGPNSEANGFGFSATTTRVSDLGRYGDIKRLEGVLFVNANINFRGMQRLSFDASRTIRIEISSPDLNVTFSTPITTGEDEEEIVQGDLNGDGDIDRDDLDILLDGIRNSSPDPAFDLNEDGVVNIADARKLITLCTRPGCATE